MWVVSFTKSVSILMSSVTANLTGNLTSSSLAISTSALKSKTNVKLIKGGVSRCDGAKLEKSYGKFSLVKIVEHVFHVDNSLQWQFLSSFLGCHKDKKIRKGFMFRYYLGLVYNVYVWETNCKNSSIISNNP